jgi:hypothetical protein
VSHSGTSNSTPSAAEDDIIPLSLSLYQNRATRRETEQREREREREGKREEKRRVNELLRNFFSPTEIHTHTHTQREIEIEIEIAHRAAVYKDCLISFSFMCTNS